MPTKTTRKPAVKRKEDSNQRTTISPEKLQHLESIDEQTRRLEGLLTNKLTRGEMNDLIRDRSPQLIEIFAERYKVTVEAFNDCLDFIAFQRRL